MKTLIKNPLIINENRTFTGSVLIENDKISAIYEDEIPQEIQAGKIIDAKGKWLIPGVIDDHVHFREPGLTHKGDFFSESRAAVAGGVTSVMDMPNTIPQTITNGLLELKRALAEQHCLTNFAFYLGATNENIDEILCANPQNVCGLKLFMGSSTGNMLVNDRKTLERIFAESPLLIATHNEDEEIIKANAEHYRKLLGENIPFSYHPKIRSEEACYRSTAFAVELAEKAGARLHVLHLTTAKELSLFSDVPLSEKRITAETCVHYLWFDDRDYARLGSRMKCNPAIKTKQDKDALIEALNSHKIDIVATDHAPHTLAEKAGTYFKAMSGTPQVQHSLNIMLELAKQGFLTKENVVEKMCHAPAKLFGIKNRGFIREGYFADLALVSPQKSWIATDENSLSKCAWTPYNEQAFTTKVSHTFVNGNLVFEEGKFNEKSRGMGLVFER
ncbi:MAG: dihydroorotase [Prevotellaceae bacterium]|jgi:dihydroorotase|nr:dihydroorotase [Prevotellaceae bacterium]